MKKIKKEKLFYKFLIFILPLIICSVVITSLVLSLTSHAYFDKSIQQDYSNIIKSSTGEIRFFMASARNSMHSLAQVMSATKFDNWQKEIACSAFIRSNPPFVSLAVFSTDGKKVVGTDFTDYTECPDKTVFQKALNGEYAVSGVFFAGDNLPRMYLALPVRALGQVAEVLWGELNLKSVWDVLEGISIGETGQVYIMDLSGRYLAHREIDKVVRTTPPKDPDILKKIRESIAPVQWTDETNGVQYFSIGKHIPELDWCVVLTQKYSEIYEYMFLTIFLSVLATGVICLVSIFLGWNWIKHLLSPIQALHSQVKSIGGGNLDEKVTLDTRDEIGDLGNAFNDMTDSLKDYIKRELENTKALLHARNLAALGTASSKVSHEVSNYINNVEMSLSVLKTAAGSDNGKRSIDILEKESRHMRDFLTSFLQFAKKPELKLTAVSAGSIIREAADMFHPAALEKGIEIAIDWPADIPKINADARLIYQVVTNLIKNSMEAMPGPGAITIKGKTENNQLAIEIKDTGEGIDPETLKQIFDPFFTTKKSKGTGLGMTIVKSIIEAHRGTIECQSEINKGTLFIIRLPLK